MVQVIPFPLSRRADLIRRQAEFYTRSSPRASENQLTHTLEQQRAALLRKGCDERAVDHEVLALEGAIRAYVWRLVLTPELG
jgi:hypothetical protein